MQTRFSGWRIAAFATVVLGLTGPGQTIGVSVFIDYFADDLELSKNAIAGGYAIGTLTGSLMMPSVGSWVDRYGVRRSMTVIAVLFSLALVAMSGVQGIISLTAGFVFIRMLGQGSLSLVGIVSISLWFEQKRGLALGIVITASSALMASVPVALTFTIGEFGWRQAWLFAAATVAIIVIPIAWFGMIDRPSMVGQYVDGIASDSDSPDIEGWGVDRSTAMNTRSFWILAGSTAIGSMLVTGVNFHQISLLGESGFSQTEAAIMFLPQVLGTSVGSPLSGFVLDRAGSRYAPAVGLALLSLTLLLAGSVSSTPAVIGYACVLGFYSGVSRTISSALVPGWFGTKHIGSIHGAMTFMGVLASAAGPIALALTESATGSFRTAALVWCGVPLIGVALATRNRLPNFHEEPVIATT